MWTEKSVLEMLINKCKEYIDKVVYDIVNKENSNLASGHYVKLFDIYKLNVAIGSGFLPIHKFREFLDWLAHVFSYYDKKIDDIEDRLDKIEDDLNRRLNVIGYNDGDIVVLGFHNGTSGDSIEFTCDSSSDISVIIEGVTSASVVVDNTGEQKKFTLFGFKQTSEAGMSGKIIISNEDERVVELNLQLLSISVTLDILSITAGGNNSGTDVDVTESKSYEFESQDIGDSAKFIVKLKHSAHIGDTDVTDVCGGDYITIITDEVHLKVGGGRQRKALVTKALTLNVLATGSSTVTFTCPHGATKSVTLNATCGDTNDFTWSDGTTINMVGNFAEEYETKSDYGTLTITKTNK